MNLIEESLDFSFLCRKSFKIKVRKHPIIVYMAVYLLYWSLEVALITYNVRGTCFSLFFTTYFFQFTELRKS